MTDIAKYNNEEFKIEPALPIPVANIRSGIYPFAQMRIGDSFFVRDITKKSNTVKNAAQGFSKTHPEFKLVCRYMKNEANEAGIRVWRVAADVVPAGK